MATGLSQQVVNRAVVELVDQVRCHFGGWSIYIPKGRVTKEDRAAEVYARHSAGETIAELAGSYGFVPTYIAGLIALEARRLQEIRQKALASARKQGVENHHG
jgi:Mor family transcriptional regulator